ncbi:MAG TPA: ATP-dependent zinc metalloprotease FtsH [Clostridia bacterium]|nr:ATP-dependent zinc metalloprotease FtsH [Clostridia bacterium]
MSQRPNNRPGGKPNPSPLRQGPNLFHIILVFFLITFALNLVFSNMVNHGESQQIQYSQFMQLVEAGLVDQVQLDAAQIQLVLRSDADIGAVQAILYPDGNVPSGEWLDRFARSSVYVTGRVEHPELADWLNGHNVSFYTPVVYESPLLSFIASWIVPVALLYMVYYFFFRSMQKRMGGSEGMGGGIFGVGKSKAKMYNMEASTGVSFNDVAGQDEAKESLMEMVDFLQDPGKYQKIGAKQPKGALLVGPPGTGKTLLAKAVAGEARVPFFSLSGSEFVEMFVGVGASRVRDLFEQAKKNAPCIIFIDEIDAIGKSRDNQIGGNDEREQTLNQLLAEMDGFDSSKGIVILAATNRPEILDKALLRPGRFDRRIVVERPDLPGREAILRVHVSKVQLGPDVNLREMALATSGATGADLANMVNEAALRAVKMDRDRVSQEDLMESVEVVIAGKEKKDRVMNPKERRMVAFHEVGHALVSALQTNSQPVQKITIVPRTLGALGFTMNMPEEERYLMTRSELLAQITSLLGGRAAEMLVFGEVSTGASNDLERATALARGMVSQYGMSDKVGSMNVATQQSPYLGGALVSNASEATNALVDQEVRRIMEECQQGALDLLKNNQDALQRIAEVLLQKENILGDEFMRLLRPDQTGGGERT